MRLVQVAALLLALALIPSSASDALAGDGDPLFVNTTTDDGHRSMMALVFSKNQLERDHPVTIFLNDRAVALASQKNAGTFAEHQALLVEMMKGGATVLICPMCMKHYGVAEGDLIEGIEVGNPDKTGAALFRDGTQTLTW